LIRGFNPEAIQGVIEDFKATMDVAKVYDVSENGTEVESIMQTPTPVPPVTEATISPQQDVPAGFMVTGNRTYAMAFEGEGKAVLTLSGVYTEEDLDDLKSYLDTSLKTLKRSVKKDSIQ
jgi:hypothetical protein